MKSSGSTVRASGAASARAPRPRPARRVSASHDRLIRTVRRPLSIARRNSSSARLRRRSSSPIRASKKARRLRPSSWRGRVQDRPCASVAAIDGVLEDKERCRSTRHRTGLALAEVEEVRASAGDRRRARARSRAASARRSAGSRIRRRPGAQLVAAAHGLPHAIGDGHEKTVAGIDGRNCR